MLLKNPYRLEKRCPWRWSLAMAGSLLALAVIVAGIGPAAKAAPDTTFAFANSPVDNKKDAQDKDDPPKDSPKQKTPPAAPPGVPQFPDGGFQPNQQRMMEMMQRMRGQMAFGFGHHARLGIHVSRPNEALVDQLDLPKDQGQVIEQIVPDSPAAKAGLKRHDVLLELNGKAVPADYQAFVKEVQDIKPDAKVDAVVLRKGKKETIKGLTLPEDKPEAFPGFPRGGFQGQPGFGRVPALPQGVPGNFAPFQPGVPAPGFGNPQPGANTVITTMFRTDDRFTTRHQEGSLIITVTGKVADGKTKLGEIQVQDGQVAHKYESVDKVPEQYHDKVKNLVDMSEKGSLKIEIKAPKEQ